MQGRNARERERERERERLLREYRGCARGEVEHQASDLQNCVRLIHGDDRISGASSEDQAVRVECETRHGSNTLAEESFVVLDEAQLFAIECRDLDLLVLDATVSSRQGKAAIGKVSTKTAITVV